MGRQDSNFWTMDHVANSGVELEIRGKRWTFRALTFRDEAEIIAKRKALALRAYMEASAVVADDENPMVKLARRRDDLSVIAYGSQAQSIDLADWLCQFEVCRRSLHGSHPDVTDAEITLILGHFETALDIGTEKKPKPEAHWHPDRSTILEIICLWSYGPKDPDAEPAGKEGAADAGA